MKELAYNICPYSPFCFEGVIFRKVGGARFPTAERRSEFQSVKESTYLAFEREGVFILSIDLPGIRKRDLKVNLNHSRLLITGTRGYKLSGETTTKRYMYKFQQTFYIDDTVDKENLKADLKNEILVISVPFLSSGIGTLKNNYGVNQVTDESEIEKTDSMDSEESIVEYSAGGGTLRQVSHDAIRNSVRKRE
jgi:HSP20 family molecular chaperone IbpA